MKQTAGKAWGAALVTLLGVPLAMWGIGDMPAPETLQDALQTLAVAGATAIGAGLTAYLKRNHPKA